MDHHDKGGNKPSANMITVLANDWTRRASDSIDALWLSGSSGTEGGGNEETERREMMMSPSTSEEFRLRKNTTEKRDWG